MRGRKPLSLVTTAALVAGLVLAIGAAPAGAAERLTTTRQVDTKMRCRASAPIVGPVDADQTVGLQVTFPQYIEQGASFDVTTLSGDTEVPFEESGITVISLRDIKSRTRFNGGLTITGAGIVPGTGSWKANATAAPAAIPGGVIVTVIGHDVELAMPGPFLPGSILTPPQVRTTLMATGAPGTKITSNFAGTIPANFLPPFADSGFNITPRVNAPIVGETDAAASCAPNYGALANGNGEPLGTVPLLSDTTILPSTNPLVSITTPGDGAKYLPDAQVFADYACTETVYPLVSCDATAADGSQLDFSTFGQKHFSVTATDANGGVTTKEVTYDVGGNVTPEVNAGTDQTVNGGALVTLHGSATDPDTGQILSYQWSQISGPPITFNPDDANDPFEPNQRFTAPRGGPLDLTFRLRVDDGFDTGEDTVSVHVTANNGPTITNPAQTINNVKTNGFVTMNGSATDPEGDTPITYQWTQVDGDGLPLDAGDPLHVTLTTPAAATTSFNAPKGPGTLRFQVVATDSLGASATGTVTVNVLANNPPVITAGASQTLNNVKTNVTAALNGTATDPDNAAPSANHILSYSWTQVDEIGGLLVPGNPAYVTLSNPLSPTPTFTTPASPTTLFFKVAVSDTYDTTVGTVTVNIVGSGTPVANAGPDQTPGRGRVVTLDGSGSTDPDGDPVTYAWTQVDALGAPLDAGDPLHVTLSSNTEQKPTFTAPLVTGPPQAIFFALTVTDVPYGLVSAADTVTINLLENQAPVANAGADQSNKATNSVVTLNGTGSTDIDAGDTISYAWTQVDPATNLPLGPGPTKVTLSNATVASPTFIAPHLPTSTTLKFQLVVTDAHSAASAPAFTNVQINANRAPAVGAPSATPASRPLGTTVTVTVPASAADLDGDPVAGFTYQWVQTDSSGTPCAPSCAVANVTLTPVAATPRSATFVAPAFNVASAQLFFRLTVNDGFGATAQSTNLTVGLTNSAASVQFSIRPKQMAPTNSTTNNTTVNQIYNGQEVELDAVQNPARTVSTLDPDGTTGFTYAWRQVTSSGGNTNCSSACIFGGAATSTLSNPVFTMPNTAQVFLRLTVSDQFGLASTTINFTLNRLANTAPSVAAFGPAFAVKGTTGVALSGTATDPQTSAAPAQTLTYLWTQVDGTGNPLPVADPLHVTIINPTTLAPTFDAPTTTGQVHFKLSVTDGAATVSQTVHIDITPGTNVAPNANAGPDQSGIAAGAVATLDGSGSLDPDGDSFTYAWTQIDDAGDPVTSGPSKVTLSSATAQKPTFAAPGNGPVTLHFRLVVTDQFLAVSTPDVVDIAINANGTPTANAGNDQSGLDAGATVTLDGSASSDPEGSAITYLWTQVDDLGVPVPAGPGKVTLSSGTAQKPTFAAPANGPVTLHFSLVVSDPFGAAGPADVVDIAVDANGIPTANAGPDQSGIAAAAPVTLDGSGSSDPESHTITYLWTQVDDLGVPVPAGPGKVTLSSATAQKPTFAAPTNGPVTLHFSLVVTDQFAAASAADVVDIAVNANGVPTANAGPNQPGVAPNAGVTLDGSGSTDPENHTITYAWTQVDGAGNPITPTVTLSNASAQKPTFTAPGTPTGTTLRFRLVVTDQYGAVSAPAFVVVSVGFNTRPTANAGPDQTPGRGKVVTLDGSGSTDPEGTTLTYQWVQTNAGGSPILPGDPLAVSLSNATAQKPTFTAPVAVADLFFRLFVTDTTGLISDPDVVVIHLVENNAPTANAGASQTNKVTNSTVTLTGTGSTDPDNDPLTYQWTQLDPATDLPLLPGPTSVTLSNATAANPTFVAPHFAASTTLKFALTVADVPYGAASSPATTTVQVNANRAPTLAAPSATPAQASRTRGATVTIQVAQPANDADGDPNAGYTYSWVQTNASGVPCSPTCDVKTVVITNANQRVATFVAPDFTVASASLFFRVTVNDGFGATVQSNNLTVALQNTAPTVPNPPTLRTGVDGSVVNPPNIYIGSPITLDATASVDPDAAGPLTYVFTGQPCGGLGEALGCLFASGASGWPGGSCRGITITNDPVEPGKATFTAPPLGVADQNPNVCGLRVVVTDAAGASTTRNWSYGLKANVGPPVPIISPVPAKVLATTATTPGVIALSGAPTTDPDTNPTQPLTYAWEQVDPTTGNPVPLNAPSRGVFSSPNTMNTTWTAPASAPYSVQFRLTATDGITFPASTLSSVVSVTTRRPGAEAGSDRLTNPGQNVLLDGSGSFDDGGRPLTYSWKQLSGPTVTLQNPFGAQASFVAPFIAQGGATQIFQFELTTRNGLAASFDTMTVINAPWPQAIANAGVAQVKATAQPAQLDGSASSTAAPTTLTYQWTQTGGPAVTLSSAAAQKPTFTAPTVTQAMGPQLLTFQLVVNDGFGPSAPATTTVTVNPVLEVPYPPTGVTAVAGNKQATVTFTPGLDGGSSVIAYVATCSSTTAAAKTVFALGSPAVVTGLTNGALYTCAVFGVNAVGNGSYSTPSNEIRPSAPPAAPTNVVAVTGNGQASVTFTPGANGGEPLVVYVVACDSSNGGVSRSGYFGAGVATVTGLTNGKTYSCKVTAAHALGISPASAPSASFVVGIPTAATAVSATPGSAQATVTWTAPATTNGSPITSYIVTPFVGTTPQAPRPFASAATSQVVTGLTNGTAYTFVVTAVNARGNAPASAASAAITVGVPLAPPAAAAAPGSAQATVSWTAPGNNGAAITGYLVTPFIGTTAQAPKLFASTATSQVITGLTNGTTYTFTVSAVNARGTGPSKATGPVTVGTPTAPPLVTATAGAAKATVTWTAPASNNGSAITGYRVTPVKAGVDQASISFDATALSRAITGLTPGVSYTFRVHAVNARGNGPQSAASNAVTPT